MAAWISLAPIVWRLATRHRSDARHQVRKEFSERKKRDGGEGGRRTGDVYRVTQISDNVAILALSAEGGRIATLFRFKIA